MSKTSTKTAAVPLALWQVAPAHSPQTTGDGNPVGTSSNDTAVLRSLVERIVEEYSQPGDRIVDLTSGSDGAAGCSLDGRSDDVDLIIATASSASDIHTQYLAALRPGGLLVTISQNTRHESRLGDVAGTTVQLCQKLGFRYLQHNIAILCDLHDARLVSPKSIRPHCLMSGLPLEAPDHSIVHQDVLVFAKPGDANA